MTTRTRIRTFAALAALLLLPVFVQAATIAIINNDGVGEGFNDTTAVAPVPGNPGTTIGTQRLFIFQYAASIWGGILPSAVPILARSQFNPLTCTPTSAVL